MTKSIMTLLLAFGLLLSGCGEDEEEGGATVAKAQGWHQQGRDCLACHNVDLQADKHLLFGGTLYKDSNVQDQDNLNNMCGGSFVVDL